MDPSNQREPVTLTRPARPEQLRRGAQWHAVRAATFDAAVRRFLAERQDGTVVALGEGLETQFWRVDSGIMRWLTVDLPETLALRRRAIPDGPRQSSHAGSALECDWLAQVDNNKPVLVTAQGLLMYFRREQVHKLIATIAERLPGSSLVFDVVPRAMVDLVRRVPGEASEQATKLWSWTFNARERTALGAIPGVTRIRDLNPPVGLGMAPLVLGGIRRLPRPVRYTLPAFPVLKIDFR